MPERLASPLAPASDAAADPRELALALARARDEADRRASENGIILDAMAALLRPQSPTRLVLRVLNALGRLVPFDGAVVLEARENGGLRVGFSTLPGLLDIAWPRSDVVARAQAGEVVILADAGRVQGFAPAEAPLARGAVLAVALPRAEPGPAPVVLLHRAVLGGFTREMGRTVRRLVILAGQALVSLEAQRLRGQAELLAREKAAAERAREASEQREAMIRGVLDAISVGIYLKDGDGRFRFVNSAAEAMLGHPVEALAGRRPSEVLPPDISAMKERDDALILSGRLSGSVVREYLLPREGGEALIEVAKSPVTLEGDRLIVATLQDVTQRRQAEQASLRAKEAAEASDRAKTQFIATVSHEIRTPLNGILGMAQALLTRPMAAEDRTALRLIKSSGDLLLGLIDNILNVAAIEAGKLDIRPTEQDLVTLLHQCAALWEERARAKGLDLVRILPGALPSRVMTDGLRLSQVLNNLLGNAVKFTATGGVLLRVEAACEDGAWRLDLAVEDTGPGIPAESRGVLFRRFAQVAPLDRQRQLPGTGLGLSICQDLVRMMGGAIAYSDRPGGGSVFRVSLPLEVLEPAPRLGLPLAGQRAWVGRAPDGTASAWRLDRMAEALTALGASVARAAEGRAPAVVVAAAEDPFLATQAAAEAPRILLGQPARGITPSGTAVTLRHGFGPSTPFDAVALALGIPPPEPPLEQRDDAAELAEGRQLDGLRLLLAEDNDVNQAVVRALLERLGCRVAVAWNGEEALHAAAARPPDAVLMDLQMPVMDGLEATRRLRQSGYANPILICTASVLPETRAACLEAGATLLLSKPLARAELVRALADAMAAVPPEATPSEPLLAELRAALDEEEVLRIGRLFETTLQERLAAIRAQLAGGSPAGVAAQAHALKSAAAMVGARRLSELMAVMENAGRAANASALAAAVEEMNRVAAATQATLARLLGPDDALRQDEIADRWSGETVRATNP